MSIRPDRQQRQGNETGIRKCRASLARNIQVKEVFTGKGKALTWSIFNRNPEGPLIDTSRARISDQVLL